MSNFLSLDTGAKSEIILLILNAETGLLCLSFQFLTDLPCFRPACIIITLNHGYPDFAFLPSPGMIRGFTLCPSQTNISNRLLHD